jgi:L-threonylcarbamoyladenylate synthase
MALVLPFGPDMPDHVIGEADRVLGSGGVVAVPTETFYALAACPFDSGAVDRIRGIKGRDEGKPILVLIGERRQLTTLVQDVPVAAAVLMESFWPGPLTLVMPAAFALAEGVTCHTESVAVRHTPRKDLGRLLTCVGPLTGTSANRSGRPAACTADDVQASLGSEIDLVLDGGRTPGMLSSTVVDTRNPVRILREGVVARNQILTVLTASGIVLAG